MKLLFTQPESKSMSSILRYPLEFIVAASPLCQSGASRVSIPSLKQEQPLVQAEVELLYQKQMSSSIMFMPMLAQEEGAVLSHVKVQPWHTWPLWSLKQH